MLRNGEAIKPQERQLIAAKLNECARHVITLLKMADEYGKVRSHVLRCQREDRRKKLLMVHMGQESPHVEVSGILK